MSRNPKRLGGLATFLMTLLILSLIAATGYMVWLCVDLANQNPEQTLPTDQIVQLPTEVPGEIQETELPTETTVPPTTEPEPVPESVVATATVSSQGDLLMHKPVFDTCRQGDGSYNFESIFRYSRDLIASFDYALANLETTFGGDDFTYQGNPAFNCPDPFLPSVVDAGYDMLLTANNHSYDTLMTGITRTLENVRAAGLGTLGTRLSEEEDRYTIVEVNGIKIGMICYTYSSGLSSEGVPRLNGNSPVENEQLVNWFYNRNPEKMYSEVETILADMEEEGIDASMLFIHWGNEYELTENGFQNQQAQALCDLGIDVIVGGHPHVVQPVELLSGTEDPDHKTICIYSLGNAVSNQRHGNIPACPTAHTEDGILFEITFEKYSDGNVYVQWADILPTWVNMHYDNGGREYNMLPLDIEKEDQWQAEFNLSDAAFGSAQRSYDRTRKIVGEGLAQIQDYLTQAKADREQYYLDLVSNP